MKSKTAPQSTKKSSRVIVKTAVRAPYTFDKVKSYLEALRDSPDGNRDFTSLRKIGKKYGVSHAVIQRALNGIEPKDNTIRHNLGMAPHTVTVEPLACGHAPSGKHCPICKPPTKYPWHPVRSRPVSDRMAIAALGALYAQRGIGEARYRAELMAWLETMSG